MFTFQIYINEYFKLQIHINEYFKLQIHVNEYFNLNKIINKSFEKVAVILTLATTKINQFHSFWIWWNNFFLNSAACIECKYKKKTKINVCMVKSLNGLFQINSICLQLDLLIVPLSYGT